MRDRDRACRRAPTASGLKAEKRMSAQPVGRYDATTGAVEFSLSISGSIIERKWARLARRETLKNASGHATRQWSRQHLSSPQPHRSTISQASDSFHAFNRCRLSNEQMNRSAPVIRAFVIQFKSTHGKSRKRKSVERAGKGRTCIGSGGTMELQSLRRETHARHSISPRTSISIINQKGAVESSDDNGATACGRTQALGKMEKRPAGESL